MDGAESIHLRYYTHGPETPALLRCGGRGATLNESRRGARHQAAAAEQADQAVGTGIGNIAIPPSDARRRAYRAWDTAARRGATNSGASGTDKGKCSKSGTRRNGTHPGRIRGRNLLPAARAGTRSNLSETISGRGAVASAKQHSSPGRGFAERFG